MAPRPYRPKVINSSRQQRITGAGVLSKTTGKAPTSKTGSKGSITSIHIKPSKKR